MSVYESLREIVVSGQIGVDDRVSEAVLAQRLGVSRTPVREALQQLEGDGLVHAKGRGVRVRVASGTALLDLLTARAGLEGWALHQAAERVAAGEVPPARLGELEELADAARTATRANDGERGAALNRAFHEAAARIAENETISTTLRHWWDQITIATREVIRNAEAAEIEGVDRDHRVILDALRSGDAQATREAAERHALSTRDTFARTARDGR